MASLLSSLGYKISHQKFEESGDKLISTKTKSLKFTELDQESLGICRYIYKNGTNALPFCIDTMPIEELYNVFINT